jgi:hypothetical protein
MFTVLKVSAFLITTGLAGRVRRSWLRRKCYVVTETDVPTDCKTHSLGEKIMTQAHLTNSTSKLIALTVAGVSLYAASAFAGPGDNFNRPLLTTLWTSNSGTLSISGGRQLVGTTLAIGTFNAGGSLSAASEVVFLHGTDLQYGAVALGNIAGGNNAFVKIQSQNASGTTFDTAGFYTGNNVPGVFFTLNSPVPSPALVDVFFCGTTAIMRITSSTGVQTYSNNYGKTFGFGDGAGTFGPIGIDNFVTNVSKCTDEPPPTPAASRPGATDKTR